MNTDQIEAYYIDVLGWTQEECSELTTDELWERLTKEQQLECKAYSK